MKNNQPISQRIKRIYLLGAAILLVFYALTFNLTLLFTENSLNMERLKVVAPHHFKQYQQGSSGTIEIDPLLTLYDSFETLPHQIQLRLDPDWRGITSLFFEDDSEHNILAQSVATANGNKTFYAIEAIEAVEVQDKYVVYIEAAIIVVAVILFLLIAKSIFNTIKAIMQPFSSLAQILEKDSRLDRIELEGEASFESVMTLDAINTYRNRISESVEREKKFTRYVSHELRTPMTVIQGSVSNLRRLADDKVQKHCGRIDRALKNMNLLTQTFLHLARNSDPENTKTKIDQQFLQDSLQPLQTTAEINKVKFHSQLLADFELNSDPLLTTVLLRNVVNNAINCSHDGAVNVFLSQSKLEVIDSGVGLSSKPRGYEGFGVGLQIVKDICDRYEWCFDIESNSQSGCKTTVVFDPVSNQRVSES